MIAYLIRFLKNKHGSLSIEFAAIFFIFITLSYVIYDIYSLITLQNKLERATYSIASLFRERSALYPGIDDSFESVHNRKIIPEQSLCQYYGQERSMAIECNGAENKELSNLKQLSEIEELAEYLVGKDIFIKIDSLFIIQSQQSPKNLADASLIEFSLSSCEKKTCDTDIVKYFANLPSIANNLLLEKNYSSLAPFVSRHPNNHLNSSITGRWIPLYRVNMCIKSDESLYLTIFPRSTTETNVLPNLCSEMTVISRCNEIDDMNSACPIYLKS